MTRTSGAIVGIVVLVAAALAAALIALQSPPGKDLAPVSVVLSIDPDGACVQTVGEKSFLVVSIKNGQRIQYTTASGSNQYAVSFPPSNFKNTGSPFQDPALGTWQYRIIGNGAATPTQPSHITPLEYVGSLFNSSVLTFPYQSVTIDNKACTVRPGSGVHVDP